MGDLPDFYQYVTPVEVEIPEGREPEFITRPKGGVLEKDSGTTTSSYVTIVSAVITDGMQFQLSRLIISAEKAMWVKWRWDGTDIGPELLLDHKTVAIIHFPWDYYEMIGDGAKVFDVQAKYYAEAGTVNVEIVGEEV